MRAAIRTGFTGYTLTFSSKHPEPISSDLKPNEILINIKAAAINPVDYKLPKAVIGSVFGLDFAGTVEALGSTESDSLQVGDEIFGRCKGSLAEKSTTKIDEVFKKPSFLTFEEAAALPTAYLTGLQGLRDAGGIFVASEALSKKEGANVLVIGASGGCGLAALQLLKGINSKSDDGYSIYRIVAICSKKNASLVLENGATEVIDYTNEAELNYFLECNVGKFDCVYDCSTGSGDKTDAYYEKSQALLLPETGQYVALNGSFGIWVKRFVSLLAKNENLVLTKTAPNDLSTICALLESGHMKPVVDVKQFTEEGIKEGFELLKSRRAKGKIVYSISS